MADEEFYDDDLAEEEEEENEEDDFDIPEEEEEEADKEEEADDEKDGPKIEEDEDSDNDDEDDLVELKKMAIQKQKQEYRTADYLTKFEIPAIIGLRAQQISEGAPIYVDIGDLKDPSKIAEKELREGKCPLLVERPLPARKLATFTYETRSLDELQITIPNL